MKNLANFNKTSGLSLIELLIAMVLGLTLASGVLQIYVGNSTTERSQEARLRIQENGRFGLNFLSQEIRMAGYLGCLGGIESATVNSTLDGPPAAFQPLTGIQGWEATGTDPGTVNNSVEDAAVAATNTAEWTSSGGNVVPVINAVPNSDIIRVWGSEGMPGLVSAITQGATPDFTAEDEIGIELNDFVLISDCEQADVVQVCAVGAGGATTGQFILSTACNPGNVASSPITSDVDVPAGDFAEAVRLQGTMFYVGKRGDVATNPPALFRRRLSATGTVDVAEELIEGVESMQILYGENLDQDVRNTVDAYLPADQVTNWTEVSSVRISLLIQSIEDGIVPSAQNYTFNGVDYSTAGAGDLPPDNRVRRVFTNTISIRNRALGI